MNNLLRGHSEAASWPRALPTQYQPSVLEGMNNRIKVLNRMDYGCHDSAYFFLKTRDVFPGKVR